MKKDKQQLLQFLKEQNFLSLSTCKDKPWICNVYYAVDNNFNLYFLSDPLSKHCRDISSNPNVACSIADSHQKVTDKKSGVQLKGVAGEVSDESIMKEALTLWNKAVPGFENIINFDNTKNNKIHSRVYQITLTSTKFFNEDLYGPEGTEIFKF